MGIGGTMYMSSLVDDISRVYFRDRQVVGNVIKTYDGIISGLPHNDNPPITVSSELASSRLRELFVTMFRFNFDWRRRCGKELVSAQ